MQIQVNKILNEHGSSCSHFQKKNVLIKKANNPAASTKLIENMLALRMLGLLIRLFHFKSAER